MSLIPDYLMKPINVERLKAAIRRIVSRPATP